MYGGSTAGLLVVSIFAHIPTLITCQTLSRLSDRDTEFTSAPFSSVYFIKERNVQSGKTEVHVIDHETSYAVPSEHYATVFDGDEWRNGKFEVVSGDSGNDLFYIKLQNTGSGKVEIHRATGESGYNSFSVQSATAFGLEDADRGTWTVDDGNLYFIKTTDTGSGNVEVHRTGASNYQQFDLHQATSLPESEGDNGSWVIVAENLYYVKYRNTRRRNVEIHALNRSDGYQRVRTFTTWFSTADSDNGTWDIGPNGDLYFIKTRDAQSGKIEIHVATASSRYQSVFHYASWVNAVDGPNGEWSVV